MIPPRQEGPNGHWIIDGFFLIVLGVVLMLASCGCAPAPGPPQMVTIIHIDHEERWGGRDGNTILELPDGTRKHWYGIWGKVGDTFPDIPGKTQ